MLAVDARWMVGAYRGMGHYAHSLLEPVANKVTAFLPESYQSAVYPSIQCGTGFFPWWEQVTLPRLCAEHGVTRLLCPYNTAPLQLPRSTELYLVVHDLIFLESWSRLPPSVSAYQTLGRIYRRNIVPRAISRAARLITVSEYTRDQIARRFSIPAREILVIPNSLGEEWYTDAPLRQDARKPYLLAVSGEAPSKNLPALIRAFSVFRRLAGAGAAEACLRIVGIKPSHQPYFRRVAEAAGVSNLTRFEPFLDEVGLRQLYREAWLFAMPSLLEGFGIPVLEAMASGTPVACSDTTSLPEVVGKAGWLFNPRDVNDIARQLHAAWHDYSGRVERTRLGLERAQYFRRTTVSTKISEFWN